MEAQDMQGMQPYQEPGQFLFEQNKMKNVINIVDKMLWGKSNVLFLRHIGIITRTSIINITAAMMIDASAAFGI